MKNKKEKIIEIISKDPFLGKDSKIPCQEMIWNEQAEQILQLFPKMKNKKISGKPK